MKYLLSLLLIGCKSIPIVSVEQEPTVITKTFNQPPKIDEPTVDPVWYLLLGLALLWLLLEDN
tara:strand:- start:783 stop:971 length:189 start_codon:yes stop_codon:yes gene_type:complete